MLMLQHEHSDRCPVVKGVVYKMIDSEGYYVCREALQEIIKSMAYEIATYRYPKQYEYSDEQLQSIMTEFGYTE